MLGIEVITSKVEKIQSKYAETDPIKLCQHLNIILLYRPMGAYTGSCKGFYIQQSRRQVIVVNSDLDEQFLRVILSHELGHAVLHRNVAGMNSFHDFTLFNEISFYEYEANIFAAELLLADREVLSLLQDGLTVFDAASIQGVPAELLDFKLRILQRRGYSEIKLPLQARGDFLKGY